MERSNSTVDKNSSTTNLGLDEFIPLEGISIKDLKVLVFTKPRKKTLDPYIKRVIEFLQRFSIS